MDNSSFSIEVQEQGEVAVLYPAGYIDFEAKEHFVPAFRKVLRDGKRKIILNFQRVKKINSMGISIILEVIDEAIEQKATIRYTNLSRMNEKLFKMIGLTEYGEIYESESEALVAF